MPIQKVITFYNIINFCLFLYTFININYIKYLDEAAVRILEGEIRATQQIAEALASAVAHSPAEAVAINGNKLAYELESLADAARRGEYILF